ncbi:MAG: hypothetical protein PHQ53_02515 [Candidatus Krumholzibacteria bacterium]|nr:hypothetical protein [Candidatus Krumholzibacteria bacterium]
MIDKLVSLVCRVFFVLAFIVLILGIVEKIANLNGYTLTRVYQPERLLEISISLAVLVMVLLLRQIRDAVRSGGRA